MHRPGVIEYIRSYSPIVHYAFVVGLPTLTSISFLSCISWGVHPKAHPFAQCFTMIANTIHPMLKTYQSSIIFRGCKLVSLWMNIFQEPKWNWHRWSSTIRTTSEQQYAKWVYSWGTTRYIHITRPNLLNTRKYNYIL